MPRITPTRAFSRACFAGQTLGAQLLVARDEDDAVVDAIAQDDRAEERSRRVDIAEEQVGHGKSHDRADRRRNAHQRHGAEATEVGPQRRGHDEQAGDGDPQDVAFHRRARDNQGGHRAAHMRHHLRVKLLRVVVPDQLLGRLVDGLARPLAEQAPGRQGRHPDVGAVLAAEYAVGEAATQPVLLGQAVLHLLDRFLILEIDQQGVLALGDLAAQTVADLGQIILAGVEPLVLLEERAQIAHVVGGELNHVLGQVVQLARQHLGVAEIGVAIGRTHTDEQQGHVAHAFLRLAQCHHAWIVAGQKLGKRGAQLQARGQRRGDHEQGGRRNQDCAGVAGDETTIAGRERLLGDHRR